MYDTDFSRFHIRSDIPMLMHEQGRSFNIKDDFIATQTTIPVTYTKDDMLFAPESGTLARIKTIASLNLKSKTGRLFFHLYHDNLGPKDESWLQHTSQYFYAFMLPENSKNIDLILVRETNVLGEAPDSQKRSQEYKPMNSTLRQKKMISNVKKQKNRWTLLETPDDLSTFALDA